MTNATGTKPKRVRVKLPRTPEQKAATKARKAAQRKAHRIKVMTTHPPSVRYAPKHAAKAKGKKKG